MSDNLRKRLSAFKRILQLLYDSVFIVLLHNI